MRTAHNALLATLVLFSVNCSSTGMVASSPDPVADTGKSDSLSSQQLTLGQARTDTLTHPWFSSTPSWFGMHNYEFDGHAGESLSFSSKIDSGVASVTLVLYKDSQANGKLIASTCCDVVAETQLDLEVPEDGTYVLSVQGYADAIAESRMDPGQ